MNLEIGDRVKVTKSPGTLLGVTGEITHIESLESGDYVRLTDLRMNGKSVTVPGYSGGLIRSGSVRRTRKNLVNFYTEEELDFVGVLSKIIGDRKPPKRHLILISRFLDKETLRQNFVCFPTAYRVAVYSPGGFDSFQILSEKQGNFSDDQLELFYSILGPLSREFHLHHDGEQVCITINRNCNLSNYGLYLVYTVFRGIFHDAQHITDVYVALRKRYPDLPRIFLALMSFSTSRFRYYGLDSLYQSPIVRGVIHLSYISPAPPAITLNHVCFDGFKSNGKENFGATGRTIQRICHSKFVNYSFGVIYNKNLYPSGDYFGYKNEKFLAKREEMEKSCKIFLSLLTEEAKKTFITEGVDNV